MTTIPQRELRNNISDILRRAEAGERFTVTVSGRPVAEVGPLHSDRPSFNGRRLAEIIRNNPVDSSWAEELKQMRREDEEAAREKYGGS